MKVMKAYALFLSIALICIDNTSAEVSRLGGDPECNGSLETHVEMTYTFFEGSGSQPNDDDISDLLVATETFFVEGFSTTFRTPTNQRRMQVASEDLPIFQGMEVTLLNNTYAPEGNPDKFVAWYSFTASFTGFTIPTSTEIVFLLETSDLDDYFVSSPFPSSQTEHIELRATPYREVVYCEVPNNIPSCVSPYLIVHVKSEGPIFIKDVDDDAEILVSRNGDIEVYEPIYAFSHKDMYSVTTFIQLYTTGNDGSPIELTGDHLIFRSDSLMDSSPVRADSIQVGDLITGDLEDEVVLEISEVQRQGIYSPQTKEGIFVGNGVKISSYTAVPEHRDNQFVDFGTLKYNITHHSVLHRATAPFRFICTAGYESACNSSKDSDGQLLFVAAGKHIVSLLSKKRALGVQSLVLSVLLIGMIAFSMLERLCFAIVILPLLFVIIFYSIYRKSTTIRVRITL